MQQEELRLLIIWPAITGGKENYMQLSNTYKRCALKNVAFEFTILNYFLFTVSVYFKKNRVANKGSKN
jgi:hypothetical protein